jgi:hypothetical protein
LEGIPAVSSFSFQPNYLAAIEREKGDANKLEGKAKKKKKKQEGQL